MDDEYKEQPYFGQNNQLGQETQSERRTRLIEQYVGNLLSTILTSELRQTLVPSDIIKIATNIADAVIKATEVE